MFPQNPQECVITPRAAAPLSTHFFLVFAVTPLVEVVSLLHTLQVVTSCSKYKLSQYPYSLRLHVRFTHTHTCTIHVFIGGVQGSGERRRSYQCGECGPGGGGEGGERGGVEPAPGERVPQQRGILHFLLLNQRTPHQIVIHL